jgi:hypothetical protein
LTGVFATAERVVTYRQQFIETIMSSRSVYDGVYAGSQAVRRDGSGVVGSLSGTDVTL